MMVETFITVLIILAFSFVFMLGRKLEAGNEWSSDYSTLEPGQVWQTKPEFDVVITQVEIVRVDRATTCFVVFEYDDEHNYASETLYEEQFKSKFVPTHIQYQRKIK